MNTLSIDSKVFSLLKGNPAINLAALDTLVRLANSNPVLNRYLSRAEAADDVRIRTAVGDELAKTIGNAAFVSGETENNRNSMAVVLQPSWFIGSDALFAGSSSSAQRWINTSAAGLITHEFDHYANVGNSLALDDLRDPGKKPFDGGPEQRFTAYVTERMKGETLGWYADLKAQQFGRTGSAEGVLYGADLKGVGAVEAELYKIEQIGRKIGLSGDTLTDFVVEQGAPFLSKSQRYWQQFSDEMSEVMNGTGVDTNLVRRRIDYQFDDIVEWDEMSRMPGETETTATYGDGSIKGWVLDDESTVIGEISGYCCLVDNSTAETTRYTDGRILRIERDGDGVVTCAARIEEHSDGSRSEILSYANGVQLRQAFDESGALIARDVVLPRWQTDPAAIESLAAGDSMLALAAFSAAIRLKTEDSLAVVRIAFARAASVSSPLILDLDGDGVETTGLADGVYFDHDGNGFAQLSGWVAWEDGLLVNDLDGDGQIRSGAELFGNETVLANGNKAANGFDALRELDGNQDAVIDAADAAFARLRVWRDANMDAVADEGELVTLAEAGVASIGLAFAESSRVDDQGNAHRQIGQWTRADGTMAEIADVWFGEDRARTQNRVGIEVPVALWSLPDLAGFGNIPDLHEAMALDRSGRLAERVRAFVAEPEEAVRRGIAEEIVMCWAGVDAIAPGSRGAYVDARALTALEHFSGETFAQLGWGVNPGQTAGKLLMEGFRALVGQMGARLEAQTQFAGLYADVMWLPDAGGDGYRADLSRVGERLHAAIVADRDAGLVQLDAFARNLKAIGLGDELSRDSLIRALIAQVDDAGIAETLRRAWLKECAGGANDDRLVGTDAAERLLGFSGNDTLSGKDGNDVIEGGAGDDVLDGGSGDDFLVGGAGNDTLNGGSGDDVYIFSGVFGHDTVRQYDATSGHIDLARFTDRRSADLLTISRVGDDLLLDFGAGEGLTVSAYFEGAPRRVAFEFADGERWDDAALKARTTRQGTSVADSLYGYNGASNLIDGLDGNDTLSGGDQADRLSGDGGDDLIYGHSGNDVLQGGKGGAP